MDRSNKPAALAAKQVHHIKTSSDEDTPKASDRVYALMHHTNLDNPDEKNKGRFTDCRAVYQYREAAVAAMEKYVNSFLPEGVFDEDKFETIRDQHGFLRGSGVRHRFNDGEEIVWVEVFEVKR